jgi:uncharacterized protein YpmB
MRKKTIVIIVVILLILIIGGLGGYFIFSLKNNNSSSSLSSLVSQITEPEEVKADFIYADESGFSFGYPKGIKVSDVTPDEDIYYSVLALAKGGEQITITVEDTDVKTIDAWIKDGLGENPSLYGATTLGDLSARQYTLDSKLYTVAVGQEVVYLIEGPKDDGFWENTQNLVVSTFEFGFDSTGSGSSIETIYEEEEIIE